MALNALNAKVLRLTCSDTHEVSRDVPRQHRYTYIHTRLENVTRNGGSHELPSRDDLMHIEISLSCPMRVFHSYPSTSLRFFHLNSRGRLRSNRRLHKGAALHQREEEDSNSGREDSSPGKQQQEGKGKDKDKDKDDYYELLLSPPFSSRTPTTKISTSTAATPSPSPSSSFASNLLEESSTRLETSVPTASPRIVFGSRLAGPAAREREGWGETRPQEPDNCCMSGCVNCVWDTFREEVEEWSAQQRQRHKQGQGQVDGRKGGVMSKVGSIDDDGGGVGDLDGVGGSNLDPDAFFKDLPVGIKEFIALEKRLKESKSVPSHGGLR